MCARRSVPPPRADTNPFVDKLQIADCRPRVNAEFNAARGKGYEHQAQYANTKLTFCSIENIHVMRASLRSFLALLQPRSLAATKEDDSYLTDLDKSGWMDHIRKLLRVSSQVRRPTHTCPGTARARAPAPTHTCPSTARARAPAPTHTCPGTARARARVTKRVPRGCCCCATASGADAPLPRVRPPPPRTGGGWSLRQLPLPS